MCKDYCNTDKRRSIIRLGAIGLSALAVPGRLLQAAQTGDRLDEADTLAKQLGYRHDARQATGRGAGQQCQACAFYQGAASSAWGGCIVFGGRQVNANGWCQSYRPKG
ncbi:MAG: high-potential iron-sulfur protein [Gammaproteobacteria bacterium]